MAKKHEMKDKNLDARTTVRDMAMNRRNERSNVVIHDGDSPL